MDCYQFINGNQTEGYTFCCGYGDFRDNDRIHPLTHVSREAHEERMEIENKLIDSIERKNPNGIIRKSDEAMHLYKYVKEKGPAYNQTPEYLGWVKRARMLLSYQVHK